MNKNFWFIIIVVFLFSCGEGEKKTENNSDEVENETEIQSDTIKIPAGPININPDKTEYATFSNATINDSVNTIHSLGVQLALVAFHNWMKETGAEVDQLEVLDHLLQAGKNNPEYLLDNASFVAHAGEQPEAGIKVSKELAAKFGIDYERPEGSFLIYSYLQKNIEFRENFNVTNDLFKGNDVYYIETNEKKWDQVTVYYYAWKDENRFSEGDFIVELYTKDSNDRVIIAQVKPEKSLDATWKKIESKMLEPFSEKKIMTKEDHDSFVFPHRMSGQDYFSMPAIDLKLEREIPELQEKTFKVKGKQKEIEFTDHSIYFRFDNFGIILIEETFATDEAMMEEEKLELPPIIVNRPFLISMERRKLNTEGKAGAKKKYRAPSLFPWLDKQCFRNDSLSEKRKIA